jgi:hypothetical protein
MKQQRAEPTRQKKPENAEAVGDLVVDQPDADLLSDIDDLLDEIDAVLEDQAVLLAYRQRPGQ